MDSKESQGKVEGSFWALVELMGHQKIAGHVSEYTFGGSAFVRVDVPAVKDSRDREIPAFTRMLGTGSIYAINPVSEEIARMLASQLQTKPVQEYQLPHYLQERQTVASSPRLEFSDDDGPDGPDSCDLDEVEDEYDVDPSDPL